MKIFTVLFNLKMQRKKRNPVQFGSVIFGFRSKIDLFIFDLIPIDFRCFANIKLLSFVEKVNTSINAVGIQLYTVHLKQLKEESKFVTKI